MGIKTKYAEVTEVIPFLDLTPRGTFVRKYRIRFKVIGTDVEDFIEVDEATYANVDEVIKKIDELAANHRKYLGLPI